MSLTYLNHHLINVGDVGKAKGFKVFRVDICNYGGTGEPMAAPCNCL